LKGKFADFDIKSHSMAIPAAVGSRDELKRLSVGFLRLPTPPRSYETGEYRSNLGIEVDDALSMAEQIEL
jgi:hypothetical protein